MTTAATVYPASPAQMSFINDLLGKREVPPAIAETIRSSQALTSRQASGYIDTLKAYPFKATAPVTGFYAAFEGVEDSKYAIPGSMLAMVMPDAIKDGDMLFLEVKTWKGRRYLNKLTGAPGDFNRTRFPMAVGIQLLGLIKGRHVEFAQNFGKFYSCCGRCAAPLTDTRSRELHVGPECRKVWGLS